jgi:hypothetical protein
VTTETALRAQLAKMLDWKEAHAGFDKAVDGIPSAQRDILDFCVNSAYEEKKWPDDYWPKSPAPKTAAEWDESIAGYRGDRERAKQLAADESIDLLAKIPHGSGQTYLRELLLVADHNSYHVGQIVIVRRALGIWGG